MASLAPSETSIACLNPAPQGASSPTHVTTAERPPQSFKRAVISSAKRLNRYGLSITPQQIAIKKWLAQATMLEQG